jgi:hypothetical protein
VESAAGGSRLAAPFAAAVVTRLDDLRATATEDLFEAALRLGRHAELLADLGAAAAAHPLDQALGPLRRSALAVLAGLDEEEDAVAR